MSDRIRNWKLLYNSYTGMQKKAVEFLYKEIGTQYIRDPGVYLHHVIPCEKETPATCLDKNVFVLGTWEESPIIQRFIKREEIPADGYLVKVMANPDNPELHIVILTGDTYREVFYAAVDFIDDYAPKGAVFQSHLYYPAKFMYGPWPDYYRASAPKIKTRSIFTWGHPINDYREYIENMARMRLNQLVIWNDFVPLNAQDVVDYAHEFGIEVLWGFSWGWYSGRNKRDIDFAHLEVLTKEVVEQYEREYAHLCGDGIYFQSFTETSEEAVNGVVIAQAVMDFVNATSGELLAKYPNLKLQFGLHATSVKKTTKYIAQVDPRVEIVWEDCGAFPFLYEAVDINNGMNFEETSEFVQKIIDLRPGAPVGMYYKGQMVMEWGAWEYGAFGHQTGPYVMGITSQETKEEDLRTNRTIWKSFQSDWLVYGKNAYDMTRMVLEKTGGNVNVGMAGQFSGKIWYSTAFTAQLLWDCSEEYEAIVDRVCRRQNLQLS